MTAAVAAIDAMLAEVRRGAERWVAFPIERHIELLERVRERTAASAARWATAAASAKGISGTPLAGEEWMSGPWGLLHALDRYLATLREIARCGAPRIPPSRMRSGPGGRTVIDVFPADAWDALLLNGIHAEVWMRPSIDCETILRTAGGWYRRSERRPRVCLILGAGNISSIAPLDALYKLVAEGAACCVKLNPVNDYLGPIFEEIFAPLVECGALRFAYGGAEVGAMLCEHELIDEIHITGSAQTHDAIVFGSGPEGAERMRRNEPRLHKPITSELGNVSPTIVVPGPWSDADIRFQAEHVATQKLHNAGFNCIAAQVLILSESWEGTPRLLAEVERLFARLPARPPYYPGAPERLRALVARRTGARCFGADGDAPLRAIAVVSPDGDDPLLSNEAFASVLAVVLLPGSGDAFLREAVRFANEHLHGTLGANLIVHPRTAREDPGAIEEAILDLRYGCIAVNAWTGVGFLLADLPWGAYPGHTLDRVGSGIGVVHNARLLEGTEKGVVYGPFAPFPRSLAGYGATLLPKPPWFVTHRRQAEIGAALCAFQHRKTPLRLARIAALAATG